MRRTIALLVSCLLSVPLFAQSKEAKEKRSLVFQNVTVIDVVKGETKSEMTVVISGNRITEVTAKSETRGGLVVDGTGKYLIPGLWDMHVHALTRWEWASLLLLANGVTGIRDTGTILGPADIIKIREGVESGSIVAPRVISSAKQIDGIPKSKAFYIEVDTAERMRQEVRRQKAEKLDFVKVYTNLSRDAFFAGLDESKKIGIPFDGHVSKFVTAREASDAGMRSIEHSWRHRAACATAEAEIGDALFEMDKAQTKGDYKTRAVLEDKIFLLGLKTYSSQKCVELGKTFAKNGTWFVPTLVEMQTRLRPEFPGEPEFEGFYKDPRLKYVSSAVADAWRQRVLMGLGNLEGQMVWGPRDDDTIMDEREQEFRNRLKMPTDLQKGGAGILAGTDADTNFPFLFFGFSLHDELELLVKGGMTPLEALRTATLNPARFLKREQELGSVEVGKLADLVLLDANPLENIANTKKIAGVVTNGKYLPRAELDAMLSKAQAIVHK